MVELLLASHADVTLKDHDDRPCLYYAIRSGHPEIVKQMIDAGADMLSKDRDGANALHYAVRHENLEVVKMTIDAGVKAAVDDTGRNSFHHLADREEKGLKTGDIEGIINLLTDQCGLDSMSAEWTAPTGQPMRISPNFTTTTSIEYVFTPLALALKSSCWRIFALLEARGATFNTTFPLDLLLFLPVHRIQPKATRFLLDRGASLSPETYSTSYFFNNAELSKSPENLAPILSHFQKLKVDINAEDNYKGTILLATVQEVDSEQVTQSFLDSGADPFKTDSKGLDTILLSALTKNTKTLQCLLQYASSHPKEDHWTAHLSPSTSTGTDEHFERIFSALERHGSLNEIRGGLTLLHRFVELNEVDKVAQLLAHGGDMEIPDGHGWRPIHIAAFKGHIDIARTLIQFGADAHAATITWRGIFTKPSLIYEGEKWTGQALHLASMCGSVSGVELLLAQGVDVNASTGVEFKSYNSGHGPTAIRIALDTGKFYGRLGQALDDDRLRIAQMLVDRGAHIDGAANHLVDTDILRFENYPALWKKLRK